MMPHIQLNQLNLAKLSSNKNLESSINLDIQATGTGSVFSEMQGSPQAEIK